MGLKINSLIDWILDFHLVGAEGKSRGKAECYETQVLIVELHDRFVAGCSRRFYQAIDGYDCDYLFGENTIAFKRGWLPDALNERGYWGSCGQPASVVPDAWRNLEAVLNRSHNTTLACCNVATNPD